MAANVDPGEFVSDEGEGEVFWAFEVAAEFGVHVGGSDAGGVEFGEEGVLFGGPVVGEAAAAGDDAGDGAAGDGANALDEHGEVVAVLHAPQDLPDVITGEGLEGVRRVDLSERLHGGSGSFQDLRLWEQFGGQMASRAKSTIKEYKTRESGMKRAG